MENDYLLNRLNQIFSNSIPMMSSYVLLSSLSEVATEKTDEVNDFDRNLESIF